MSLSNNLFLKGTLFSFHEVIMSFCNTIESTIVIMQEHNFSHSVIKQQSACSLNPVSHCQDFKEEHALRLPYLSPIMLI